MNFEIEFARNGEYTLKLNNKYVYSKYNPKSDAQKFIENELEPAAVGYLLVGLGIGYHLEALANIYPNKKIIVIVLDAREMEIYNNYALNKHLLNSKNIEIINHSKIEHDIVDFQVIIPNSWINAIGVEHPLFFQLEDIKIRQMSYKSKKDLLEKNFRQNILNNDISILGFKKVFEKMSACLVAAGPSLDESIELVKAAKRKCFILCVGSALKVLLKQNIVPDAIIITDPLLQVVKQIEDTNYTGPLFYLSTANHEMTLHHQGKRFILFQEGYPLSEENIVRFESELIETGGSVATTGLSLLEYMGFNDIYLFGQDLGFKGEYTHSQQSTSGIKVKSNLEFRKVLSNNNEYIKTTSNLNTYHRWIARKVKSSSINIFNMSLNGAKIEGIQYIDNRNFYYNIEKLPTINFTKILLSE